MNNIETPSTKKSKLHKWQIALIVLLSLSGFAVLILFLTALYFLKNVNLNSAVDFMHLGVVFFCTFLGLSVIYVILDVIKKSQENGKQKNKKLKIYFAVGLGFTLLYLFSFYVLTIPLSKNTIVINVFQIVFITAWALSVLFGVLTVAIRPIEKKEKTGISNFIIAIMLSVIIVLLFVLFKTLFDNSTQTLFILTCINVCLISITRGIKVSSHYFRAKKKILQEKKAELRELELEFEAKQTAEYDTGKTK